MIYGVYFYETIGISKSSTFIAGFYKNIEDAKSRLNQIIPNYTKYINNTVKNNNMVGWINKYEFGDFNFDLYKGLNASQPHSSINLFDTH